jgi:tripartite ATP-independent transporter DctM subunit
MVWVFFIGGLIITAAAAAPLGVGLALTGLVILEFMLGGATSLAFTAVWNVFNEFTLSAVPLYILMGEIMLRSGISTRVYTALAPLFLKIPGQLLHTNIAVCTLFGAVSGASMSTAAAVGTVAYPELRTRGYHKPLIVGTLAAGGTLGLLIPPSLSLLLYGATQGVSISKLFLAGIIPGLLLALGFSIVIGMIALRRPERVPNAETTDALPWSIILRRAVGIWPLFLLIFAVLGTIYMGLATPTEAAGLGVFTAVIIGVLWGDLTGSKLIEALVGATRTFGAVLFVAVGALILAQAISALGIPRQIMSDLTLMELSPNMVLAGMVLIYLLLGCFFDGLSLLLMTVPVVFPVMVNMGFDPVWLGVIITICIEIGMLTPPVGANLFVLTGITNGEVSLSSASVAALPFWFVLIGGIIVLTVFPGIVLFLPDLLS